MRCDSEWKIAADEHSRRADRVSLMCEIEFRRHAGARYRVDLLDFRHRAAASLGG